MNKPVKKETKLEEKVSNIISSLKSESKGSVQNFISKIKKPLQDAGDFINQIPEKIPGKEWIVEKSGGNLVKLFNDLSQWLVPQKQLEQNYLNAGLPAVSNIEAINELDIQDVEKVIGSIREKYKQIADHYSEGTNSSNSSFPSIPDDINALISLNTKAISEFATHYGFDISQKQERLFALNILSYASSTSEATKHAALVQLIKSSNDFISKKGEKKLDKNTFITAIKTLASSISIKLTKAKVGQSLKGAVIGGGFNAYFTNEVIDTAHLLYRERFLAEKTGADFIGDCELPEE